MKAWSTSAGRAVALRAPKLLAVAPRLAIVVATALFSLLLPVAPAHAAAPVQTLNLLGSGANVALGQPDPSAEVSFDNGVTWGPAYVVSGSTGPAAGAPWPTAAGTTGWLNCRPDNNQCGTPTVYALFRYKFWVPSDFQNASVTGQLNADNAASVYFNGFNPGNLAANRAIGPILNVDANGCLPYNPSGLPAKPGTGALNCSSASGSPANIQSLLVPGWNTMYVTLTDLGGLSGISYNLTISINAETPMRLSSPGNIVNFDPLGGQVDPVFKTVATGAALSTITLPTPVWAGYSFTGWYTAATGGVEVTPAYASATIPTTDITLYARWTPTPAPIWTLQYDGNGGSCTAPSQSAADGVWLNTYGSSACTRPGYVFTGWSTRPDGTGLGFTPGAATQMTGDATLYAKWSAIQVSASNDAFITGEGTPVSGDLKANDSVPAGARYAASSGAGHGTVIVDPDGTFTYVPVAGFAGTDSFTYEVCAPAGAPCATATVTITVTSRPLPPVVAPPRAPVTGTVVIPAVTEPGSVFTLVTPPKSGVVDLRPSGEYSYTPEPGFVGMDSFTYQECPNAGAPCRIGTVRLSIGGAPQCANGPRAGIIAFRQLDASLDRQARARLRALEVRGCEVRVIGYVEPTPSTANDGSLSRARAVSVASFLSCLGAEVSAVSAGRRSLQDACTTSDNRCVIVRIGR